MHRFDVDHPVPPRQNKRISSSLYVFLASLSHPFFLFIYYLLFIFNPLHFPCPTKCVLVVSTGTASGYERTDFLEEIETMKVVAEGNNPHVVGLIGCVTIQEPICLVTEFVKYGDLLTYLTTIRKMVDTYA